MQEGARSAVLTFVLVQDGYTSVLFNCVLRTTITTVSSRTYYDSRGFVAALVISKFMNIANNRSVLYQCKCVVRE